MYTGIAILFVPILNVFWMIILLIVISIYDAYAVWKSKHMVKMANFQMIKQVDKKITNKKYGISFADFKAQQLRK